jgi:hypothetical protein
MGRSCEYGGARAPGSVAIAPLGEAVGVVGRLASAVRRRARGRSGGSPPGARRALALAALRRGAGERLDGEGRARGTTTGFRGEQRPLPSENAVLVAGEGARRPRGGGLKVRPRCGGTSAGWFRACALAFQRKIPALRAPTSEVSSSALRALLSGSRTAWRAPKARSPPGREGC